MKWIGLTGGVATGKSSVTKLLRKWNYPVIDADELARLAVQKKSENLNKIVKTFGSELLTEDGNLNREKLASIVFKDPVKKNLLESILHPWIKIEASKQKKSLMDSGNFKIAFYDVPLLFEKNLELEFDYTVLVYCPEEIQLKRLMQRNNLNLDEAKLRLANQISIEEKRKKANFIIDNSQTLSHLEVETKKVLDQLLDL